MTADPRLFAITGGPGSGKTSLCVALAAQGINIAAESGRAIIQAQQAESGRALPWVDPQAFAAAIFAHDKDRYAAALLQPGVTLFDRSFPDNAAYLTMLGLPVPAELETACRQKRFAEPVFIAPPWKEIYTQDSERKQDWAEAVRTYDAMVAGYQHYGYALVEVPRLSVSDRADFILDVMRR